MITSRALAETGGDAAVYADGARELTQAMSRVVEDSELRACLSRQSLARAREFSWDSAARLTHEVYREASKRFAG